MKVRHLMTDEVFVVNRGQPILRAEAVMKWARTRHVPVVDSKSNLVGLITHRDILAASITSLVRVPADANKDFLASFPLENAMKRHVTCIDPDASLPLAASLMLEKKIGCLPVTRDGKLLGIITEADFVSVARFCPEQAVVDQIMSTDLWTADTKNNLLFIEALMRWARIRHVPYVDDNGHLVGIISHRDLLRACFSSLLSVDRRSQKRYLRRINVGEIANRDVCTTTPNSLIRDVAKTMLELKIGALPVLDGDELVGIVTEADLVKVVARVFADLDPQWEGQNSVLRARWPGACPPHIS